MANRWTAALVLAAAAAVALVGVVVLRSSEAASDEANELLLKVHLEAHEPYSPPPNLYLWWGPQTNHRFTGSGEHIRHLFHLGQIEGGEWRDPMFLGNNGVATFRSQRFRRISNACCSTILIPPMEWEWPVYNVHKMIGQRIRNFVANGNMLILTGGILSLEFINSYFFYNIELVDGNYSPGPYKRLKDVPEQFLQAPSVLPQKGISVTAVKKDTLPSGTEVLWGTPRSTPVFMIKFCEAQNPNEGMPPTKVLPRDCPAAEADGRPCSCGYIMYVGYTYHEPFPTRWDKVLRAAVEILSPVSGQKKDQNWQQLAVHSDHSGEHKTGASAKLAAADSTIKLQQHEIQALEKSVHQLETQQPEQSEKRNAKISQLKKEREAVHLAAVEAVQLARVKAREGARGRNHRRNRRTTSEVLRSVKGLSKDMRQLNKKMEKLANRVSAQGKKLERATDDHSLGI